MEDKDLKWPYNSELYLTIGELKRAMPKPDFTHLGVTIKFDFANMHITKPVKPQLPDAPSL